jgi:hypothetical protein
MDTSGMIVALSEASRVLSRPSFQSLVGNGQIRQDELSTTGNFFTAAIMSLKTSPPDKIQAMFDKYNNEITGYLNDFNIHGNTLDSFRNAQMMVGNLTTIMMKCGIRT